MRLAARPIGRATMPTLCDVRWANVFNEVDVTSSAPPMPIASSTTTAPARGDERPQRFGDEGTDPAAGVVEVVEPGRDLAGTVDHVERAHAPPRRSATQPTTSRNGLALCALADERHADRTDGDRHDEPAERR